ncbi:TetR/AcrR family transcriptional regulator [Bradyrhizobium sp. WD16]|uniref:TetR/AcrR family transcriptional regulator n=1 Tax=Bradyrhizobium sp. WD16 TaxID=1521768 RepID=UPI0020A4C4A2|nr:TetR/AcrR family transcriptional regulator [Bradyrhizobium sp. WD16]UTD30547.1 TetR/AcrR family transcriptional regulator [Bradyrhizobium sp. WD16]
MTVDGPDGLTVYREGIRAEKRAALLDAALSAFLELGYERTGLDEIARRAGVSAATLHKHFSRKADLFGAVVECTWGALTSEAASLPATLDKLKPADALKQIGKAHAALLCRPEIVQLFRAVIAETPRFPELGTELFRRAKDPFRARLHSYLDRATAAGVLRVKKSDLATRQFLDMINGALFWPRLLVVDEERSDWDANLIIKEAVTTFLARYSVAKNK